MPKTIRFIELELINFTSHRNLKFNYTDITKLTGKNGAGKTSIGTSPVWILYGNDLLGKTFNPSPTNYEFDRVFASQILSVDGAPYKFAREINEKGVNQFYINDVPTKAKEYEAAVASLFDKDEFLSLYNPSFFFTLHWTKQREQVLKYTTAPAKSSVLAEMSRTNQPHETPIKSIPLNPAAQKLDELTKKHNLEDLKKIHSTQKTKLEKDHIAAQSRTKTLQEQLNRLAKPSEQFSAIEAQAKADGLLEQVKAVEKVTSYADESNKKINILNAKIQTLQDQISASAAAWPALKDEPIEDTCRTCKRTLDEESVKAVTDEKEKRKEQYQLNHKALVAQRKALEAERDTITYIDVVEQLEQIRSLEEQRRLLTDAIRDAGEWDRLTADVDKAKVAEESTHTSLKESIFILDAIKSYRAKEAELQAAKVQSLFTTLSIRLFKFVKTSGEYEPAFEIQMDGKDYSALSTGERIAAGLELSEVLYKQSELIVPTFIDGIGEYTGKVAVYGQLITGRAVEDEPLKINGKVVA